MNLIKLSNLNPGEKGIIEDFSEPTFSLKLLEMGCLPGEEVIFHKLAPLGDPMLIEVSGYFLSLRKIEAENIIIRRQHVL